MENSLWAHEQDMAVADFCLVIFGSLIWSSWPPLVYVRFLIWETKFHTHTKQLAELWFCIF
jgi:hypothetical protein